MAIEQTDPGVVNWSPPPSRCSWPYQLSSLGRADRTDEFRLGAPS
jgi:hypothetical protein